MGRKGGQPFLGFNGCTCMLLLQATPGGWMYMLCTARRRKGDQQRRSPTALPLHVTNSCSITPTLAAHPAIATCAGVVRRGMDAALTRSHAVGFRWPPVSLTRSRRLSLVVGLFVPCLLESGGCAFGTKACNVPRHLPGRPRRRHVMPADDTEGGKRDGANGALAAKDITGDATGDVPRCHA